MEDPNLHLLVFLEVCDTLKINGTFNDRIYLSLLPFSLWDKVRAWLHSLPPRSITTYDELTKAFLAKFFPLSKITSLRNQITSFAQWRMNSFRRLGAIWGPFKIMPYHRL